ncbi:MAG: hypothetical protein HQ558_07500 [Candidatus Omnitrophica bacterium]|nr:hypothetical protein [Candidatus Omnitrophota bacterium]
MAGNILTKALVRASRLKGSLHQALFHMRYEKGHAEISGFRKEYSVLKQALEPAYQDYITSISTPESAISLECACLVMFLARTLKPKVILDMGSGFSSYIFRLYQKEAGSCEVCSVDDSAHWLENTKAYISKHGLSIEGLYEWGDFNRKYQSMRADLILFDFSTPSTRLAALPMLIRYCHKDTLICADDVHKTSIREGLENFIRLHGLHYMDTASIAKDSYGRYQRILFGFDD